VIALYFAITVAQVHSKRDSDKHGIRSVDPPSFSSNNH